MPVKNKRQFEYLPPNQQRAEIWEQLSILNSGQAASLAQPREITFADEFVQFPSVEGYSVTVYNDTGKQIAVRRGSESTVFYEVADGFGRTINVEANANELYIKNNSDSDSVTLTYEVGGEQIL